MYERVFHSENPFWRGMGRLFDIVELNLLWLLCCIPLFTAGPSTAALYAAMTGLLRGEESYLHRDFFRAFRRNFRRNTAAGLLLAVTGAFLWTDVWMARQAGSGIFAFCMAFFFVLFLLWCCVALYALPILAVYGGSLRGVLILAFTNAIRHLPLTLALLAITAAACWICHLAPLLAIAAVGISVHTKSALLLGVLRPLISAGEHTEAGDDADREQAADNTDNAVGEQAADNTDSADNAGSVSGKQTAGGADGA